MSESYSSPLIEEEIILVYVYQHLFENSRFDTARQSQIEAARSERGIPSRRGKGDEEDQFDKVVASQKGNFQIDAGILS